MPGQNHVDIDVVDVGALGGEHLAVKAEQVGLRLRQREQLDRVAGLLRSLFGVRFAELEVLPHQAAENRDGDGLRSDRTEGQRNPGQQILERNVPVNGLLNFNE